MSDTTNLNTPEQQLMSTDDFSINQESLEHDVTALVQQAYLKGIVKPGDKVEIMFEPKIQVNGTIYKINDLN